MSDGPGRGTIALIAACVLLVVGGAVAIRRAQHQAGTDPLALVHGRKGRRPAVDRDPVQDHRAELAGEWLLLDGRLRRGPDEARQWARSLEPIHLQLRTSATDPEVVAAQRARLDELAAHPEWLAAPGVEAGVARIEQLLSTDQ